MKPRSYTSEGIILGRRNFGEADRILSIYSKDKGKISIMAKGVRMPKSRKRGHLEVFSQVKFQATSSRGMDIMVEVEVSNDFEGIRGNLAKISLAYYFCEVVSKITHEGEHSFELYSLIVRNLNELKDGKGLKLLRFNFVQELLTVMGYWPNNLKLPNPDEVLEEVIERQIYSSRVGKRMVS